MDKKQSSWTYQKGRYVQINIKFFTEDADAMKVYHYLKSRDNITEYIKKKVQEDINDE